MSAAKGQVEQQDMELEKEEDEACAPNKYYEYLHSLNDRQKEAACNDVAVPLMIVAGPGSGKVYIFVLLSLCIQRVYFFDRLESNILDI